MNMGIITELRNGVAVSMAFLFIACLFTFSFVISSNSILNENENQIWEIYIEASGTPMFTGFKLIVGE